MNSRSRYDPDNICTEVYLRFDVKFGHGYEVLLANIVLNSADQTDLPRLPCSFLAYINPAAIYENLLELFYIQRAEEHVTASVPRRLKNLKR